MSEYICVPEEDVRDHVESALRECSRMIALKVREHLEAAHDDEMFTVTLERAQEAISDNGWDVDDLDMTLSLDEVTRAIDQNGWGFDELDIKPDLDAVRDIVQAHDWSASELGIASTNIDDCVTEHGTRDVLDAILNHDENGPVTVAHTLWGLMRQADRDAFLAKIMPAAPAVDLDKLREDIRLEVGPKMRAAARAEMLEKLATLLG